MPVIMQACKTTITLLAIGVNRHVNWDRCCSMAPVGIARYINANIPDSRRQHLLQRAGDRAQPRTVFTHFQVVLPNNVEQFRDGEKQPILWPEKYRTSKIIHPYSDAKH